MATNFLRIGYHFEEFHALYPCTSWKTFSGITSHKERTPISDTEADGLLLSRSVRLLKDTASVLLNFKVWKSHSVIRKNVITAIKTITAHFILLKMSLILEEVVHINCTHQEWN